MRSQVFQERPSLNAWVRLLRTHSAVTRALSAELAADHGLTLNDYEVLLHLAQAPDRRLRRVDLAERLLLTASGITRLLDGLERADYVTKAQCQSDARVTYAVLTEQGLEKLRTAADSHVASVRELFESRFTEDELETLTGLLARLPAGSTDEGSCTPD